MILNSYIYWHWWDEKRKIIQYLLEGKKAEILHIQGSFFSFLLKPKIYHKSGRIKNVNDAEYLLKSCEKDVEYLKKKTFLSIQLFCSCSYQNQLMCH